MGSEGVASDGRAVCLPTVPGRKAECGNTHTSGSEDRWAARGSSPLISSVDLGQGSGVLGFKLGWGRSY